MISPTAIIETHRQDGLSLDEAIEAIQRAGVKPDFARAEVKRVYELSAFGGDNPIRKAKELFHAILPPTKWIARDFLPEGLTLCAATFKFGKSWLCLHLGLAVAEGKQALGAFPTAQGDVLYLALEDNARRLPSTIINTRKD